MMSGRPTLPEQTATPGDPMLPEGRSLSVPRKLGFTALALLFACSLPEIGLRLLGFEHATTLERMSFSFPLDDFNRSSEEPFLQRHPTRFWQPVPGVLGHNSQGFYGGEFSEQKPPGTLRIVCLGDSCTHFGPEPWPERLQQRLTNQQMTSCEVINASCLGYTSWQGQILMNESVRNWSPDIVTVYFGWNDHWLSRGLSDHQQTARPSRLQELTDSLSSLRTYQLLHQILKTPATGAPVPLRVPPDQYAENLKRICHECRRVGADCWFITAPHALDILVPEYLVSAGEVESLSDVMPLHASYNEIVRQEAKTLNCRCIDAERAFDAMDKRDLFLTDAIHLSDQGRSVLADLLFTELQEWDDEDGPNFTRHPAEKKRDGLTKNF